MNLAELTEAMHRFVTAKGWYAENSPRPQTPRNLAVSLSIEAGEMLELFQWSDEVEDQTALASEMADITLYLLQLASLSGIDLETAVMEKLNMNYNRTW